MATFWSATTAAQARRVQRHDECPGALQPTSPLIENLRILAEVGRRRIAAVELQYCGYSWVSNLESSEEAANRGVRTDEAASAV